MNKKKIEEIVQNSAASLAMEGLICTEEEKETLRRALGGEISFETAIEESVNSVLQKK